MTHKNTKEMQLREDIRQQVALNDDVINAIAKATDRRFRTVERWLIENNEYLTLAASLSIIKEFTGLTESEILVETEAKATA